MNFSKRYYLIITITFTFIFCVFFPAYSNDGVITNSSFENDILKLQKILKYKNDAAKALGVGTEQISKFCPDFKEDDTKSPNSIVYELLDQDITAFNQQIDKIYKLEESLEEKIEDASAKFCPSISSLFGLKLSVPQKCEDLNTLKIQLEEFSRKTSEYEKLLGEIFNTYLKLNFFQEKNCISPDFLNRLYTKERNTQNNMSSIEFDILLSIITKLNNRIELINDE